MIFNKFKKYKTQTHSQCYTNTHTDSSSYTVAVGYRITSS